MPLASLSLNSTIKACDHCLLRAAKGLGVGNPQASMLLLAQNPGTARPDENAGRIPFELHLWESRRTTRSSEVLRETMLDVGFRLEDFYVTNTMKCEGKVQDRYVENCADWLEGELLNLRQLKLIVALGQIAGKRIGNERTFKLTYYMSRIDEQVQWVTAYVNHPAATLYPDGVSKANYRDQWRFVYAVYDRMTRRK